VTKSRTQGEAMKQNKNNQPRKPVSRGRHEINCKVCQHEDHVAIEAEFVNWKSPSQIAEDWGLRDRTTLYRHAWATGLMERRRRNIRVALESIIEQASAVEVTAGAVVQAIVAYSKISSEGRFVERSERVDLNALFEKMTKDELLAYAETGKLPDWFEQTVGKPATAEQGTETEDAL
jgi:hypothetical protein